MKILNIASILGLIAMIYAVSSGGFSAQAQDRIVPGSQMQMQLSFAPLVKKVAPAVVNIYTSRIVSQRAYNPFMDDPFFSRFFGRQNLGGQMRRRVENSLGSGVIVAADGLIVTNEHVIRGADEITVVLNDGREFEADLTLADAASDLALLRIREADGLELPFVELKPSENLQVGDLVLAIGNPFGVGQTVTSGIISAQGRSTLDINDFNFFIQTDAAINPGNSGGPLVTLDGGVVGINTAIYSRDGGSLGLGFAVPSEMVASVIAAEKAGSAGKDGVLRPWLGVSVQEVTSDIAQSLDLSSPRGALVVGLHSASPLSRSGVKVGDLITALDGREIRDAGELRFRMATVPLGNKAEIEYMRAGQKRTASILAMKPPEDPPREETFVEGRNPLGGATIANINPAVSTELGLKEEEGVVIMNIARGSIAARFLRIGDVLLEINGKDIEDVGDVESGLQRQKSSGFEIVYSRGGQVGQVVIR